MAILRYIKWKLSSTCKTSTNPNGHWSQVIQISGGSLYTIFSWLLQIDYQNIPWISSIKQDFHLAMMLPGQMTGWLPNRMGMLLEIAGLDEDVAGSNEDDEDVAGLDEDVAGSDGDVAG